MRKLFLLLILLSFYSHAQNIAVMRGDSVIITVKAQGNYLDDPMSFVVKAGKDFNDNRLIMKTTDDDVSTEYGNLFTYVSVIIRPIDTEDLGAKTYYYDVYDSVYKKTIVNGNFTILSDVQTPFDGVDLPYNGTRFYVAGTFIDINTPHNSVFLWDSLNQQMAVIPLDSLEVGVDTAFVKSIVSDTADALRLSLDGKANTTLNNLGTTAINTSLLPIGTQNLGSSGMRWDKLYVNSIDVPTAFTIGTAIKGNSYGLFLGGSGPVASGGRNNFGYGDASLFYISGHNNIAIGNSALRNAYKTSSNQAFGYSALYSFEGDSSVYSGGNIAFGEESMYNLVNGMHNYAMGYHTLYGLSTRASHNIAIGYTAGKFLNDASTLKTKGWHNIYLGTNTYSGADSTWNEIVIGLGAKGGGSNTVTLGAGITDTYLKGKVHMNNDLEVDGYGYFADSIVVGNSTVKIYPDSITIGGVKVDPSGGGLSENTVKALIQDTSATLRGLINDKLDKSAFGDSVQKYLGDAGLSKNEVENIVGDSLQANNWSWITQSEVENIIGDSLTNSASTIASAETLDSLARAFWNNELGGGGDSFDSTYVYQRITALEDSITAFRSILDSILAALDDKLDKLLLAGGNADQVLAKIDSSDYNFTWATIQGGGPVFSADTIPPHPPTGLEATATSGSNITLNWTDPADGDLDSIRIYEYKNATEDSTAMTWIASVGAGVETYNRGGLDPETTYWYRLKAMDDSSNVSYFSNVDSATTQASSGGIPVIESFTTDSVGASATITLTKPSGVQNGDLLLIVVASEDPTDTQQWNNTTNKPTGFTWLSTTIGGGVGTGQNDCQTHIAAFYRIADGSEGATVGVTSVGTGNDQVGYYLRLSGVYGASPIDVWDSPLDSTLYQQTDTIQIHSQTTRYDNELALVVCANDGGNYGLTVSGTGWSAVSDNWIDDSEYGLHLIIGKKDMPSAGATGQAIITSSVTTPHGSKVGMILTVRSQ